MKNPELDEYLQATLKLHGLKLDEQRSLELARQFALLHEMATLVQACPLDAEIEPANVYRP